MGLDKAGIVGSEVAWMGAVRIEWIGLVQRLSSRFLRCWKFNLPECARQIVDVR